MKPGQTGDGMTGTNPWSWFAWVGLLGIVALQLAALTANWNFVFHASEIYFVDADCYSRMTRVASILNGGPWSIRSHVFENWPYGTTPHTTALLDWLIAIPSWVLLQLGIDNARDVCGAWISPAFGVLLVIALWVWGGIMRVSRRWIMLSLVAISPIVTQAFQLGRPDHQSLILLLIATGVGLEVMLWKIPATRIAYAWGILWGLALWVSLYEPLILFSALFLIRALYLQKAAFDRVWVRAYVMFLAVVLVAILFDGWRVWPGDGDAAVTQYFPRWGRMLGELQSVPFWSSVWFDWMGFGILVIFPGVLWMGWKKNGTFLIPLAGVTLLAGILTLWQLRWAAIFVVFVAMLAPFVLGDLWPRKRVVIGVAWILSLWPVAATWESLLFPSDAVAARKLEQLAENIQLREVATRIASESPQGFLAPWWISPAIAYWSGQPGVGGSSHQSLSGIADSARFFLSADPRMAAQILNQRQVTWVIFDDPDRTLQTAATLLERTIPADALGRFGATKFTSASPWMPGLAPVFDPGYFQLYHWDLGSSW